MSSFSELTNQLHFLNDLILADMVYDDEDYAQETLDFNKHLLATKSWFMRTSFANKKRYLLALLNDVKRAWTLSLILKSIWNCRPKDAVMSVSQPQQVWSSYDRSPLDHNRTAVSIKMLAQAMINDRKWFLSLDSEHQALVLTDLLTISGGPIVWEVYCRAQHLYERYRDRQFKRILELIVVGESHPRTSKEIPKLESKLNIQKLTGSEKIKESTLKAMKDLEVAQAAWSAKLKHLRESQKLEEIEIVFKDGTKNKIWKVNRQRPEAIETSDFLQLLPGTVGKKILSYLDQDLLNSYAQVNKYWAYLIDSYKNETAAREKLNEDLTMLRDTMLNHDISIDMLVQYPIGKTTSYTAGFSLNQSIRSKNQASASYRPSERSLAFSFRHFISDEKLKPKFKKQRPIRNIRELTERLDRRGAADLNLWRWCKYVIKETPPEMVHKKHEEGLLRFRGIHFPCPLMKFSVDLPVKPPLNKDPVLVTSTFPRPKRNISNTSITPTPNEIQNKRYRLWSRNFSELYKAYRLASHQSPF